jgi:predicted phage-related endonuclease
MNPQENNRLDYMAAELDSLKSDVSEVKAIVKDMHNLLSGNPIDRDSSGMIGDLRTMNREVYALKAEIKKYKAYFYAIVTLIGLGILKVIIDFLKGL